MRIDLRARVGAAIGAVVAGAVVAACAPPPVMGTRPPPRTLAGTDGAPHVLPPDGPQRFTVVFFFDDHCPCQAAHDPRLRDLYAQYHPRGVDFVAVDPAHGATLDRDRAEAEKRAYPFPILLDPEGSLARGMGAEYATETFVLDRSGTVRYHGGIDSDRSHLQESASMYLRDALDDLLDGRPPRRAESKALGCALQTM